MADSLTLSMGNGSVLAGVQFAKSEVIDLIIEEEEFRRHEVYSK